ncbi:MAG: hypothetical protein Q8Q14_12150 [Gemmatimonadales bacterium]|nr:hypothetical protein [Gemmatimonadales bacterium]
MKRMISTILLGLTLGCTTLRPVNDYQTYVTTTKPSRVWVTTREAGRPLLVEGPRLVHDTLVGFVGGRYREFAPGDLQHVRIKRPATGRTTLLLGTSLAVAATLVVLLASNGPQTSPPTPEDPAARLLRP